LQGPREKGIYDRKEKKKKDRGGKEIEDIVTGGGQAREIVFQKGKNQWSWGRDSCTWKGAKRPVSWESRLPRKYSRWAGPDTICIGKNAK